MSTTESSTGVRAVERYVVEYCVYAQLAHGLDEVSPVVKIGEE